MLTCKNHPTLRWTCKSIAFTPGHGYNGQRHIFFNGERLADGKTSTYVQEGFENYRIVHECKCPPTDLIIAPEDEWGQLSLEEQRAAIEKD